MRSFLLSTGVLVLMIVLIVCNAVYVRGVTKEFAEKLNTLPPCTLAAAEALLARWREAEHLLQLSVCATDMNEIEDHLAVLCAASRTNDEKAFEQARTLCLCSIARIRELERFSFLHIL
jgi:hypothetical protein